MPRHRTAGPAPRAIALNREAETPELRVEGLQERIAPRLAANHHEETLGHSAD